MSVEDLIAGIRADYQRIEKQAPQLATTRKTLEGFSLEGGYADFYYDGSELVKVKATHFGEMGRTVQEFFFRAEQLVFMYERVHSYNEPFGEVQRTDENRYYFADSQMIRWRGPDNALISQSEPGYLSAQQQHLRDAADMVAAFHGGSPTIVRKSADE